MRSAIIYCPHLNRDIRGLLNHVPNPFILTGQKTERGEDGCLQCHQELVALAKRNNWPHLFVMEDDCEFTAHFNWQHWCEDAAWAEAQGYGCLVGGCVQTYDPRIVLRGGLGRSVLVEVSKFHSAHCIVYFAAGYDGALKTVQPYDTSLGDCGVRTLMTYPFVAVQRASFSGILRSNVNYVPLYQQYEEHLGRALGLRA